MSLHRRALLLALAGVAATAAPAGAIEELVYWPVVTDHEDWNVISAAPECVRLRCFGAPRPVSRLENPTRRHAGVDLFANAGDTVVAIEAGRVIAFYPFLRARTGEMTYALLIQHGGYVANYGEVRDRARVAVGDAVEAGEPIAEVSDTAQLHFETYASGRSRNQSWRYDAPQPTGVIDPTPRLLDLLTRAQRRRPAR